MDCAFKKMYSYSLIETIYNALFKKTKVADEVPCAAFSDWMKEIDRAQG